jgi:predicted dehydrogenase
MGHGDFKVGIIGAGGVVRQFHLPGWAALSNVSVLALADLNKAAAAPLAHQYGVPNVFTDYRELLRMDIDAVDICTPNVSHAPIVREALEAGKHVLCEKPLAVTAREVRELGGLADRAGRVLMTAQHHRFSSPSLAAKQWCSQGNLGDTYHARVRAMRRATLPTSPGFIDRRLSGGGPCMDIGVHALDLCLWLMDFPAPARVSGAAKANFAKGHRIPGMWGEWDRGLFSVEDFAAGFVHFENGATLVLETAWLGHQQEIEDMSCQVFGLDGGLKWPSTEFASVQGGVFAQGTLTHPWKIDQPHTEVQRAFQDCVVNGKPSPVPWRETHKVIAILEAIYASQEQGREISLELA